MDQETFGSIVFLASLLGTGCAEGADGAGPRPTPYPGNGDDSRGASPWTDPLETTGADSKDGAGDGAEDGGDESGWPGEGETGQISGGSTGNGPSDGSGGFDTDFGTSGDEGDEGDYGSTGYDSPPPPPGNPCPDLVQLYTECIPELEYATEMGYCEDARQTAASISAACSLAHTDYLACLSTLDCASLLVQGTPLPCFLQGANLEFSC